MIYETCVLLRPETGDDGFAKIKSLVEEVVSAKGGEVVLGEDWGVRELAQATSTGIRNGRYIYIMYSADTSSNDEIERRLGINEEVMKYLFIKLGEDANKEALVKAHVNPFKPRTDDKSRGDIAKERKMFTRKRTCWFTANGIKASWKDPTTYQWLVNEFGKLSPARVSGISQKHQRFVTSAVKQARNIGLISHMSGYTAR